MASTPSTVVLLQPSKDYTGLLSPSQHIAKTTKLHRWLELALRHDPDPSLRNH